MHALVCGSRKGKVVGKGITPLRHSGSAQCCFCSKYKSQYDYHLDDSIRTFSIYRSLQYQIFHYTRNRHFSFILYRPKLHKERSICL